MIAPTKTLPRDLRIKTQDRAFYVGQTGTGKSYLAGLVCASFKRLIAIDTIGDLEEQFPNMEEWTKGKGNKLKAGGNARLIIRRPALDEEDIANWFEGVARQVLEIGNVQLYIDEANQVLPNRMLRKYALMLFTQGRHYRVGTHVATQRPSKIQTESLSEAQHFFVFRLINPDDQLKIRKMIGWYAYPPDEHGFYYYRIGERPIYYPEARAVPYKANKDENNVLSE